MRRSPTNAPMEPTPPPSFTCPVVDVIRTCSSWRTYGVILHRSAMYRTKLTRIRDVDLQRIDLGIAMCHFELTAREDGLPGRWSRRSPDMGPVPTHTQYVVSWTGA
jgi:hypothetical protein